MYIDEKAGEDEEVYEDDEAEEELQVKDESDAGDGDGCWFGCRMLIETMKWSWEWIRGLLLV